MFLAGTVAIRQHQISDRIVRNVTIWNVPVPRGTTGGEGKWVGRGRCGWQKWGVASVVYPEVDEWSFVESDLRQSTSMSCSLRFTGSSSSHHAYSFSKYLFQLRRSASGDKRPYQRHGVLVEVRLATNRQHQTSPVRPVTIHDTIRLDNMALCQLTHARKSHSVWTQLTLNPRNT